MQVRSTICLLLACGSVAFAQQPPPKPVFEVASVKAADPELADSLFAGMSADPSFVTYRNITLRDAIRGAYKVRDFQIVGPDWMSTAHFDIGAKLPPGGTTEQIPEMFQALLEERFKLTWRREPKEMQVYALVTAKEGAKLKPTQMLANNQPMAMGTDGKPRAAVVFGGSASSMTVTAPAASLLTLVGVITRFTSRPVVDETGIEGVYDFSVTFAPETDAGFPRGFQGAEAANPAPALSEAVKKYGLRIESRKAPIDMFVVTRIEKTPTEN
jgi:uncharacterized protein (TIGR03435 family)